MATCRELEDAAACAPIAGNPLSLGERIGAALLSSEISSGDPRHNPLFVYITGRGNNVSFSGPIAVAVWMMICAFEVLMIFGLILRAPEFHHILRILLIGAPVVILLGAATGVVGTLVTSRTLRGRIPREELLLTRLSPREIVDAIPIKALAANSFLVLVYSTVTAAALAARWLLNDTPAFQLSTTAAWAAVSCIVLVGLRWYMTTSMMELGAAVALRAKLRAQSSPGALLQGCIEILFYKPLTLTFLILALVGAWVSPGFIVAMFFCIALPVLALAHMIAFFERFSTNYRSIDFQMQEAAEALRERWLEGE